MDLQTDLMGYQHGWSRWGGAPTTSIWLMETISSPEDDIIDDLTKGMRDFLFLRTPCERFTASGSDDDGGPRPLRSIEHIMG